MLARIQLGTARKETMMMEKCTIFSGVEILTRGGPDTTVSWWKLRAGTPAFRDWRTARRERKPCLEIMAEA